MELGRRRVPLCANTEDQALVPLFTPFGAMSASSASLLPQVQSILEEIVLLQEAAHKYQIEAEEQFQTWFWALKRLSEKER